MKILTDRFIYGCKPKRQRQIFTEPDGFILRVEPTGSKFFYYRYTSNGKTKYKRIGKFDAITLAEARERHRELVKKRERGEIDIEEKRFSTLVDDYIKAKGDDYADSGKEILRIMGKDVIPLIGEKNIKDIGKQDIYPILQRITKRGSPRQSNITLEKISVMFRFACSIGLLNNNPCLYMPKEKENDPRTNTLSDEEILFLLGQSSGVWNILKLMLFTGCRGGEAKNISYSDITGNVWVCKQIKGGKTTLKRTYLTPAAIELIGKGKGRVFDISDATSLAKFARRQKLGYTPHDIRRTVSTRLAESFPIEHIDRLLGHRLPKVTAAYNHYSYDEEIKNMLLAWEKKLICLKN